MLYIVYIYAYFSPNEFIEMLKSLIKLKNFIRQEQISIKLRHEVKFVLVNKSYIFLNLKTFPIVSRATAFYF